jgi:hypothetical protein
MSTTGAVFRGTHQAAPQSEAAWLCASCGEAGNGFLGRNVGLGECRDRGEISVHSGLATNLFMSVRDRHRCC